MQGTTKSSQKDLVLESASNYTKSLWTSQVHTMILKRSSLDDRNTTHGKTLLGSPMHPKLLLCTAHHRGRTFAKKLRFLCKKRAGYANLKMLCIYCTQKTVTSHIKMRLVFSFFALSREGLESTCHGSKHLRFPPPPPPSLPHRIPVKGCWCLRDDVHDTHRHWSHTHVMRAAD